MTPQSHRDLDLHNFRAHAMVLFRALCTVGGVLSPAVALVAGSQGLTVDGILWGMGAGALGLLGALRSNLATMRWEDKEKARLPETEILLRNHDLNNLVGIALDRALTEASTEPPFAQYKPLVEGMRKQIPDYFRKLDEGEAYHFLQQEAQNMVVHFARQHAEPNDQVATV